LPAGDEELWREVRELPEQQRWESSTCLPIHCSFQFDVLPIPPASLLVRDLGDLRPQDVTPQVQRRAALVQVSEPNQFVRSLGARLAAGQNPAPTVTADVVDGADVFLITLTGLGDDSIGDSTWCGTTPRHRSRPSCGRSSSRVARGASPWTKQASRWISASERGRPHLVARRV
jgi:hypothetical protein